MGRARGSAVSNVLIGVGVAGTAMTLLAGFAQLDIVRLTQRVADLIHIWRAVSRDVWRVLVGWLGVDPRGPVLTLLNFMVFAFAMAIGVRIKAAVMAAVWGEQGAPSAFASTRLWRLAIAAIVLAVLVPVIAFGTMSLFERPSNPAKYVPWTPRPAWIGIAQTALMLGGIAVSMLLAFGWVNGWTKAVLQTFALSVVYSICLYGAPVLEAAGTVEGQSDWGVTTGDMIALAWMLSPPAVCLVVFSLMLKIAPAPALRDRLLMSTALTVVMLVVNMLMAWLWR